MLRVGRGERREFANFLFLNLGGYHWDFYSAEPLEHHLANNDQYFLDIVENEEGVRINWDDQGLVLGLMVLLVILQLYVRGYF